jgi:hypothetical protein
MPAPGIRPKVVGVLTIGVARGASVRVIGACAPDAPLRDPRAASGRPNPTSARQGVIP